MCSSSWNGGFSYCILGKIGKMKLSTALCNFRPALQGNEQCLISLNISPFGNITKIVYLRCHHDNCPTVTNLARYRLSVIRRGVARSVYILIWQTIVDVVVNISKVKCSELITNILTQLHNQTTIILRFTSLPSEIASPFTRYTGKPKAFSI